MPSANKEIDNGLTFRNTSENGLNGETNDSLVMTTDDSSVEPMDQADSYDFVYDLNQIKELLKKPLKHDQFWCILSKQWLEDCLTFLETPDDQIKHPGPIDNSPILNETTLKNGQKQVRLMSDLQEDINFVTIPEELCEYLIKKFGTVSGFGETIFKRPILDKGKGYLIVEIYPLEIRLTKYASKQDFVVEYNGNTTLLDIIIDMKKRFDVPATRPVQLFHNSTLLVNHNDIESALESKSNTSTENTTLGISLPSSPAFKKLHECSFEPRIILTLEVQNVDGTWPSSKLSKIGAMTRSKAMSGDPTFVPGLCGLSNLGNTCFMNSALQCLSNTPTLTKFLLSDKYLEDINEDNPLGNGGEIARVYADLIKAMWSGYHNVIAPREFKLSVSRFAPQFCGFSQHDCQELLSFLLDGLHEDMNRVRKKPYIENKEGIDQRPDEVVAKESWKNYKLRNDSIIVDTFHSQLKSTLVCPECNLVSITFDPFCYLTLPLPFKHPRTVGSIVFIPAHSKRPLFSKTSYSSASDQIISVRSILIENVSIPKTGQVFEISNCVAKLLNEALNKKGETLLGRQVDPDRLKVTTISANRLQRILTPESPYNQTLDDIHIYEEEEPIMNGNRPVQSFTIPIFIREVTKGILTRARPFLINVPDMSYEQILNAILVELSSVAKNSESFLMFVKNSQNQSNILRDGSDGEGSDKEEDSQNGLPESDSPAENGDDTQLPYNTRSKNFANMFSISVVNRYAEGSKTENTIVRPQTSLEYSESLFLAVNMTTDLLAKFFPNDINLHNQVRFNDMVSMNYDSPKKGLTLSECINQFTQTEKLGSDDPWYCPRCKQHQRASKKFDIWSLPDTLIIHLKRFSYSRYQRDKLDVLVECPLEQLDMTPYVLHNPNNENFTYDLLAVANHFGGLGGGHYTAFAKNIHTKDWHCFDDTSVSLATDSVVTKNAYVLFYQRRLAGNTQIDVVMSDVSSSKAS